MPGVDTTVLDGFLKKVYTDGVIQNLQNMEAETITKLTKSPKKPGGEGFVGPAHVQGNQRGQGSQNENERLRDSGSQVVKQWKIKPKVFTHTIRFSGLSLEIAKGNEESFADNLTFHTDNGVKDSTKEENAQMYRDGSGVIALVNGAVVASTTVVFDTGVPTHFRHGMFIDIVTAGGVKEVSGIEIVDIDVANLTLTLAFPVTCSNNSRIARERTLDLAPPDGKEFAGYPIACDDGTIRASYEDIVRVGAGQVPLWRGFTIDGTGVNISNDFLQKSVFRLKVLSGTKVKRIRSNTSQFRKYLDLVVPSIRFPRPDGKDKGMDSGMQQMPTWNGMEWVVDTDIDFQDIYMEDDNFMQMYEVRPLRMDDTDGGKILKWDPGFDGFVAYLKHYANPGSENPRKGLRIRNLNAPAF